MNIFTSLLIFNFWFDEQIKVLERKVKPYDVLPGSVNLPRLLVSKQDSVT